jgi:hypothetical protein
MQHWEQARLARRGEGAPFWTLIPEFEEYFEELRALAGEPAPGTTGRVLPKYEESWGEVFWQLIKRRQEWWKRAADEAGQKTKSSL